MGFDDLQASIVRACAVRAGSSPTSTWRSAPASFRTDRGTIAIPAPAHTQANLRRLAAALRELEARVYTESVPEGLEFDCSAQALARADMWNLITAAGRLDVAFTPSGTAGYDDLARNAVSFDVFGIRLDAVDVVSGPARGYLNYERAAPAFSGSQMLMWRVSGMMNRQMMKQTAGTTMG